MGLWVELNGQRREFAALATGDPLSQLIDCLGLKGDRIAVEQNGEIVRRQDWAETPVAQDDRLEVVHFVGGGTR